MLEFDRCICLIGEGSGQPEMGVQALMGVLTMLSPAAKFVGVRAGWPSICVLVIFIRMGLQGLPAETSPFIGCWYCLVMARYGGCWTCGGVAVACCTCRIC